MRGQSDPKVLLENLSVRRDFDISIEPLSPLQPRLSSTCQLSTTNRLAIDALAANSTLLT